MSRCTIVDSFSELENYIASNDLVFVDFWADWCGPCKMMSPVIDSLAEEYSDSVLFIKVNADAVPEASERFNIMNLPTMLLFKNGIIIQKLIGARPKSALQKIIAETK